MQSSNTFQMAQRIFYEEHLDRMRCGALEPGKCATLRFASTSSCHVNSENYRDSERRYRLHFTASHAAVLAMSVREDVGM